MDLCRRQFLRFVGAGSAAYLSPQARGDEVPFPAQRSRSAGPDFFTPITPSDADQLIIPEGFTSQVVIGWGDRLGSRGPLGPEHFGFNNDFIAYFPIDAREGGKNPSEALLWVNHEYVNPLFVSKYEGKGKKTREQIRAEKLAVGGSVVRVSLEDGQWRPIVGSKYNRRFTALYPEIAFTGPAVSIVAAGTGTLANCSGGQTPWHTVLSCEENYDGFNPTQGGRWSDVPEEMLDERQYGWVVEVDPFGELPPAKHTALGRFMHENASLRIGPTGRLVVYMGDDANDQHLYKYVSNERYDPNASRASNRKLLSDGVLYAADFGNGRWLPLDLKQNPKLQAAGFITQADVLVRTRQAARALGATPLDRCEDCEVHPLDGSLYVAMTNNSSHGNFYGQIVRLVENDDNPEGESFRFEVFLAGGPQSGLACPDNLAFDAQGNLWVVCDISSSKLGEGIYKPFGNNGVYVVPTRGDAAGDAFQFASGPVDCEVTGPCFSEDGKTLFLAVQHPGEESASLDQLTSHWPDGGKAIPRPAVVAIRGF